MLKVNEQDKKKSTYGSVEDESDSREPVKPTKSSKQDKKHETPKKKEQAKRPVQSKNKKFKEDEEKAPFTPLCEIIDPEVFNESDSSEDEGLPDYKIGGYHPVHVGEVFLDRYIIVQKLGWGHFSTVWLTKDLKFDTFVALKIQKSSQNYLEAAYDEVEILDVVSKQSKTEEWRKSMSYYYRKLSEEERKEKSDTDWYWVQLLNSFCHYGPNGKHFVMVFEIMGVNLLEIIKRYDYKGVPIPLVRKIAKQWLIGLDYLHRLWNIIHTDLKPENVLVCLTKAEIEQIATENRLKNSKKDKNHLIRDRNVAEFALGNAFKNLKTGERTKPSEKEKDNKGEKDTKNVNKNWEYVPLTYADIIPDYNSFNKNQKKKLRK